MKKFKEVIVDERSYDDVAQKNAGQFMAYWDALLSKVPDEFKSSAYIRLDPRVNCQEEGYIVVRVGYRREETRNERVLRVVAERSIEARERERELSTLRDLMQAFPLETKEILEQLTTDK